MSNILILANYAPRAVLEHLDELTHRVQDTIKIIVKDGDEFNNSPLIVSHQPDMQGDVCDLLWEAAKLVQNQPLIIASVRGLMNYEKLDTKIVDDYSADLLISCTESTYGGFKFDSEGTVCESAELPASTPYVVIFKETSVFTKAAEEVILKHKSEKDGKFELRTVVNQIILHDAKITVVKDNYEE